MLMVCVATSLPSPKQWVSPTDFPGDRGAFPMVLKGPGLKKVSLELVFGAESFFSHEGSLSENTPKKKPVLSLQSRPAGTFVCGTDPVSLSHQAACPIRQPVLSGSSSMKRASHLGFTEGAACGQSLEDRVKTLAEVKRILENTGFPWHVVALEEVGGSVLVEGPVEGYHQAPWASDSVSPFHPGRSSACRHQCCAALPRSRQGQRRPTRQPWTASCSSGMC